LAVDSAAVFCIDQRDGHFEHPINSTGKYPMTEETNPPPFTTAEINRELVNDSLGTIDTADSSGSDETKETGDAKHGNTQTRED
jgi:hypothetical protein